MKREISPNMQAIKRQYVSCVVTLFASFLIGMAVDIVLITIPLGLIIGHTGSLLEHILHIVVTMAAMFVLCYKEGYYNGKFVFKPFFISIIFTFITQVVLVFVFGPTMWLSGPTISIASDLFDAKHPDLVGAAWSITRETIYNYRWIFMIIAFWVLYAPSMILGKYLGSKNGKKDSEKTKEKIKNEKVFGERLP